MKKSRLLYVMSFTIFSMISASSHAALIPKLDGQVVYDDDLNITWLANSSLSIFNTFGITSGINFDGTMTWDTALSWIAGMNQANYLGFSNWRLPRTLVPDSSCNDLDGTQRTDSQGWDCTGSEIGHLVYEELDAARTTSVVDSADTDELFKFSVVWPGIYWSSTVVVDDPALAYMFDWSLALQTYINTTGYGYAWAVHDGDIGAVPIPAALWLFGSGLLGLVGMARRKAG